MALTKFLILAFVLTLVVLRLRQVIRAVRAQLEAARSSVANNARHGAVQSIDLIRCARCGDAVPQSRTNLTQGLQVCSRCSAREAESPNDA